MEYHIQEDCIHTVVPHNFVQLELLLKGKIIVTLAMIVIARAVKNSLVFAQAASRTQNRGQLMVGFVTPSLTVLIQLDRSKF